MDILKNSLDNMSFLKVLVLKTIVRKKKSLNWPDISSEISLGNFESDARIRPVTMGDGILVTSALSANGFLDRSMWTNVVKCGMIFNITSSLSTASQLYNDNQANVLKIIQENIKKNTWTA